MHRKNSHARDLCAFNIVLCCTVSEYNQIVTAIDMFWARSFIHLSWFLHLSFHQSISVHRKPKCCLISCPDRFHCLSIRLPWTWTHALADQFALHGSVNSSTKFESVKYNNHCVLYSQCHLTQQNNIENCERWRYIC